MNHLTAIVAALPLLGAALCGVELAARRWLRARGDYVWRPCEHTAMHLDRGALPQLPPLVRFDINRDGERGADPPRRGKGLFRVLVTGGSAAECFLLDQRDSWPEVLAAELARGALLERLGRKRVHVGNIAKSGVDSAGLNLILERVLFRYRRLDCIVISLGAGDVQNWLNRGAPVPFRPAQPEPKRLFFSRNLRDYGWRPARTALAELARMLRDRLVRQQRHGVGKTLARVRRMRAEARQVIRCTPDPSGMLDALELNLRALVATSRGMAEHLLVLPQPWFEKERYTPEEERLLWHVALGKPYEEQVDTYYSFAVFNELMRLARQRIFRTCAELGVATLDLQALLPNSTETYYDQFHFTHVGSRRVGQAVAARLAETVKEASPAAARACALSDALPQGRSALCD